MRRRTLINTLSILVAILFALMLSVAVAGMPGGDTLVYIGVAAIIFAILGALRIVLRLLIGLFYRVFG